MGLLRMNTGILLNELRPLMKEKNQTFEKKKDSAICSVYSAI